jgi:hypothetical protein
MGIVPIAPDKKAKKHKQFITLKVKNIAPSLNFVDYVVKGLG